MGGDCRGLWVGEALKVGGDCRGLKGGWVGTVEVGGWGL